MIRRIELINFMSHEHTVIEPAEGLTVLVGPNNCGKSAVVAALQILCHNDKSTYVTRHGAKECIVRVETEDNDGRHLIEWRRKDSPSYTIDGDKYDRLRANLPQPLHAILRMPQVASDSNNKFNVHFGEQKTPVFLLGGSAGQAAQFFASSSDAAKLVQMQALHRRRMADARRDQTTLMAQAEEYTAAMEALQPVPDLVERTHRLEADHASWREHANNLQRAKLIETSWNELAVLFEQRAAEARILDALTPPPRLVKTEPIAELIGEIAGVARDWTRAAANSDALRSLPTPVQLADLRPLTALIENLRQTLARHEIAEESISALSMLHAASAQHDVKALAVLLQQLSEQELRQQNLHDLASVVGNLSDPPALQETASLKRLIADLDTATRQCGVADRRVDSYRRLQPTPIDTASDRRELSLTIENLAKALERFNQSSAEMASLDAELAEAGETLKNWGREHPVCPTCGGPVDPDRLVAQAAAGIRGHDHG